MITRVIRVSTRLTTNPGASSTRIGRLRSCSPTAHDSREGLVVVSAARTTSSSGITATGLKKCMPATRSGCLSSAAMSVMDSAEVFVASMQSVARRRRSSSANTRCLTSSSSKTASSDEVAVREPSYVRAARDERREERVPSPRRSDPARPGVDLSADRPARRRRSRASRRGGRRAPRAGSRKSDAICARHQPARRRSRPSATLRGVRARPARMLLRALLDEVERVDGRLRLRSG